MQHKQGSKDELQKSLFCWGEGYLQCVCLGEEKCGHGCVLVLRLSSDWKCSGGNKTDLRAAHQDEHKSACSVSLCQGRGRESLTFLIFVCEAL